MKYRTKPRVVAAARRPFGDRSYGVVHAEWEGFCLLHRLIEPRGTSRYARRYARSVPTGWAEIQRGLGGSWVVVDTGPDGKPVVRCLSDDEFAAEFEPTEQAWEGRRDALLAWARHRLATADADYLRLNRADLDHAPWTEPILRAERERIHALVQESGRTYDQTFDPEHPDRELRTPPPPPALRVTADLAAVLEVLLDQPGERLPGREIRDRSGLSWKAARLLWRLHEAGWADHHTDEPGSTDTRLWWLTDTGIRLGRERLGRRARSNRQTGSDTP